MEAPEELYGGSQASMLPAVMVVKVVVVMEAVVVEPVMEPVKIAVVEAAKIMTTEVAKTMPSIPEISHAKCAIPGHTWRGRGDTSAHR